MWHQVQLLVLALFFLPISAIFRSLRRTITVLRNQSGRRFEPFQAIATLLLWTLCALKKFCQIRVIFYQTNIWLRLVKKLSGNSSGSSDLLSFCPLSLLFHLFFVLIRKKARLKNASRRRKSPSVQQPGRPSLRRPMPGLGSPGTEGPKGQVDEQEGCSLQVLRSEHLPRHHRAVAGLPVSQRAQRGAERNAHDVGRPHWEVHDGDERPAKERRPRDRARAHCSGFHSIIFLSTAQLESHEHCQHLYFIAFGCKGSRSLINLCKWCRLNLVAWLGVMF